MKNTLYTLLLLFSVYVATAQNTTYKYHFNGVYSAEPGSGAPALAPGCAGTFSTESLPIGVSKTVHQFNKGCGLLYSDAVKNLIASGNYTIEMYFKIDTITGYKKLIDFDSLSLDKGLYNQNGKIVLYSPFTSADSFIGAGQWVYVAITHDVASKNMYINCNGKTAGKHADATNQFVYSSAKKLLIFFQDDKGTSGNECTKGSVAMIHISNYVMDSTTIKNNFTNLGATLGIDNKEANTAKTLVYPNPASGNIYVTVPADCSYGIYDITGRQVGTGSLKQGDNAVCIESLQSGLHILKLKTSDNAWSDVQRFSKQ